MYDTDHIRRMCNESVSNSDDSRFSRDREHLYPAQLEAPDTNTIRQKQFNILFNLKNTNLP